MCVMLSTVYTILSKTLLPTCLQQDSDRPLASKNKRKIPSTIKNFLIDSHVSKVVAVLEKKRKVPVFLELWAETLVQVIVLNSRRCDQHHYLFTVM